MKKVVAILFAVACAATATAQRAINFNADWMINGKKVTLPRAWNEADAFRVPIEKLPTGTVTYRKEFVAPKAWKGKKIFIEFEGARQAAEVFLNGNRIGLHENGVMAFGFDLTPFLRIGKSNVLEVRTDNSWSYKEKGTPTDGEVLTDGNGLPNNTLAPASFQWNNKNFNANYGGLPKNVRLHVTDLLYQTLPLYSALGTTGTYIYAKDIDVEGRTATVHAESEIKNETGKRQTFTYCVDIIDRDGTTVASFTSGPFSIEAGDTRTVSAEETVGGLHFWSWGYGYLYDSPTYLRYKGKSHDRQTTVTGFRKTAFR
ncbi:MAG: beta-galactosidase, partial [Bacteroidaceae bacterium]|nr:beta-galactosidase [Bacteroidaceae bacterium]